MSVATSHGGPNPPDVDPLVQLCHALAELHCLRLRLRFSQIDGSGPAPQLDEQVWRGALKHGLDEAVRVRLMPPVGSTASGSPPPPGLTLRADGAGVQLALYGRAVADAHAVLQALIAAAAGAVVHSGPGALSGLGARGVKAWLDAVELPDATATAWQPTDLPTDPGELAHCARPLASCFAAPAQALAADRSWTRLAVCFDTPCALPKQTQPPGLQALMRALWPRLYGLVAAWHRPEALPARDELPRAVARLPDLPTLPGSAWWPDARPVRSGRQQTRWLQEAYRGCLLYGHVPPSAALLLQLGQAFGLGQGATLGMGRYSLLVGGDPLANR